MERPKESDNVIAIDFNNTDKSVPLHQLIKLLDKHFYEDNFPEAEQVVLFTEKMAPLGKIVLDKNSSIVLEEDDEELKQFL